MIRFEVSHQQMIDENDPNPNPKGGAGAGTVKVNGPVFFDRELHEFSEVRN